MSIRVSDNSPNPGVNQAPEENNPLDTLRQLVGSGDESNPDGVDQQGGQSSLFSGQGGQVANYVRSQLPTDVTLAEGSAEFEASVLHDEGTFGTPGGAYYGRGSVDVLSAQASAQGRVGVDLANGQLFAEGRAQGSVALIQAEGEVHSNLGGYGEAHARGELFVGARASAEGRAVFDPSTGTIRGDFQAEALVGAYARGEASAKIGELEAQLRGEAFAGAQAQVRGNVVFDPSKGNIGASVKGGAFVGAYAQAEGSISAGGVGATGAARAYAGVGVQFEATAKFEDGKLNLAFDIGAAVGVGVGFKIDLTIDIPKVVDTVAKYVPGAGAAFDALETGGKIVKGLGKLFGKGKKKKAAKKAQAQPRDNQAKVGGDKNQPKLNEPAARDATRTQKQGNPPSIHETLIQNKLQKEWSGGFEERKDYTFKGEKKIG